MSKLLPYTKEYYQKDLYISWGLPYTDLGKELNIKPMTNDEIHNLLIPQYLRDKEILTTKDRQRNEITGMINGFPYDALRIRHACYVHDLSIVDDFLSTKIGHQIRTRFDELNKEISMGRVTVPPVPGFDKVAHRDAIQLIPLTVDGVDPYGGAHLKDVAIRDCTITSNNQLQGIFASDGVFENISIINNTIDTQSYHKITLCGLLNGKINGNIDVNGDPVQVKVLPLRLGGGANYYVLSFKQGGPYEYGKIHGISDEQDLRRTPTGKHDLYDFDMVSFYERYASSTINRNYRAGHVIDEMLSAGECRI